MARRDVARRSDAHHGADMHEPTEGSADLGGIQRGGEKRSAQTRHLC
jgi:hypothetical protein